MKMKQVTLKFSVLAASVVLLTACPKKTPNVPPTADTEVESAIDATWANHVVTDMDMICSYLGENVYLQGTPFYFPVPGTENPATASGTITAIRDSSSKDLIMSFNQTKCLDGRVRDGSIFISYKKDPISNPSANENSRYYRDFGFVGRVRLSDYKVDGWLIKLFNPNAPAYIYNKISTDKYDPKTTDITWLIAGKFLLVHPTDTTKNIVWNGQLMKKLSNTEDPKVFAPSKAAAITWTNAVLHYYGSVEGNTSRTVPYKMEINEATPLVRDWQCSPDKVMGVVSTPTTGGNFVLTQRVEEYHPFIRGIASFTTGYNSNDEKYPRQIFYGNEGSQDLQWQCDNVGEVQIKGISYAVNWRK